MTGLVYDGMPVYTRAEVIEYQRQMLVWGDVQIGADGRPVPREPREESEYWKYFTVGGRGNGKTARISAALDGSRAAIAWLDEHIAMLDVAFRDREQGVRDLVRRSSLVPETPAIPEIEEFTWACYAPTDMPAPGTPDWYARQATEFLAGWSR